MIVDVHTHVFPPAVRERRAELAASEPAFAALYGDGGAAMATAEDLIASMDEAGVDCSLMMNFAWQDGGLIAETNEYLLEAAASSNGRLLAFASVDFGTVVRHAADEAVERSLRPDARSTIRKVASAGARGIGELRPEDNGFNLANSDEADLLAWASAAFDLPLLLHASEPVGHHYAGKAGLPIDALYMFARQAPGVTIIAAHWGGGLPFYALMPEVREALATTYFDTAAEHLLYGTAIYRTAIDIVSAERILFGSDFPLTSQANALARTRGAGLTEAELSAICGGNAARLFGL